MFFALTILVNRFVFSLEAKVCSCARSRSTTNGWGFF